MSNDSGNRSLCISGLRSYSEFDNHEMVITISDKDSGLRAFIAIHNTQLGSALGGTRAQVYASEEDALRDVLRLSRAMSYKCALANLPFGGGKAVIILDKSAHNRHGLLETYAKRVETLGGLFKTGTDVGIGDDDVAEMGKYTSHMLGLTDADRGDLCTSKCASMGVFSAMKAVLEELDATDDFHGKSIAIKGVGKLGGELARLVIEAGGRVMVADIDTDKCIALGKQLPVETVALEDIHKMPVDIYSPCALGNEFTEKTISELACRAIVGGANNQLPSDQAGYDLYNNGILYAPDYVTNGGGLIYVADELEPNGFQKERVLAKIDGIADTLRDIFARSKHSNVPPHRVADQLAEDRMRF